jgi:hypothetical protein
MSPHLSGFLSTTRPAPFWVFQWVSGSTKHVPGRSSVALRKYFCASSTPLLSPNQGRAPRSAWLVAQSFGFSRANKITPVNVGKLYRLPNSLDSREKLCIRAAKPCCLRNVSKLFRDLNHTSSSMVAPGTKLHPQIRATTDASTVEPGGEDALRQAQRP